MPFNVGCPGCCCKIRAMFKACSWGLSPMESLLQLAVSASGRALCSGYLFDLSLIPEEGLAEGVWESWRRCLSAAAAAGHPPPLHRQHQVLQRFAAAFWRPQLLRLSYPPPLHSSLSPGLASLPLVSSRLLHLELCAPGLTNLDSIAAACPQLRCLSLRGCTTLTDASVAALGQLSTLQALDLGGLAALKDAAVFHVAKLLPKLSAINLSGTAVGDRCIEFLVYGHRVRQWQAAERVEELPPEAAAWPALPLQHLQLAGTRVGPPGLAQLEALPQLRFLDARYNGTPQSVLGPLQRRFALQAVQAAVLTDSSSTAAAVLNFDAVLCRCGCRDSGTGGGGMGLHPGAVVGTATDLQAWRADGVRLLLHFDPASGLSGLLAGSQRALHGVASAHKQLAQVGVPGGRRRGFREPRLLQAPAGSSSQHMGSGGGPHTRKRPLQWQ